MTLVQAVMRDGDREIKGRRWLGGRRGVQTCGEPGCAQRTGRRGGRLPGLGLITWFHTLVPVVLPRRQGQVGHSVLCPAQPGQLCKRAKGGASRPHFSVPCFFPGVAPGYFLPVLLLTQSLKSWNALCWPRTASHPPWKAAEPGRSGTGQGRSRSILPQGSTPWSYTDLSLGSGDGTSSPVCPSFYPLDSFALHRLAPSLSARPRYLAALVLTLV